MPISPRYNNYESITENIFQPNNATVGVAIHLPFLNLAQHARVQEAESEALKAKKQAEARATRSPKKLCACSAL